MRLFAARTSAWIPATIATLTMSAAALWIPTGTASAQPVPPPEPPPATVHDHASPAPMPTRLPMPASTDRWVIGDGGVRLRVHEYGRPAASAPTVVLVHGYMSTARAWDQIVARLVADYHVVTYDTRGNGDSDHPMRQQDYALPVLARDIAAVIDVTAPGRRVHLVGWDWGAAEGWEAAAHPATAAKILDFTAVSGLNLDLWGRWIRHSVGSPADVPDVIDQAARSSYMAAWDVPIVTDVLWNSGAMGAIMDGFVRFEGAPPPHVPARDGLASLNRYRANVFSRLTAPTYSRVAVSKVHVIYGSRDPYIGKPVQTRALDGAADRMTFTGIDSGHWSPVTDPELLTAALVAGFGGPS